MPKALVGNAGDSGQVREAERKVRDQEKQAALDLDALCKLPEFERFARRFIGECGVFSSVFDRDPYQTAFNDGQRTPGLRLLTAIEATNPATFARVLLSTSTEAP